MAIDCDSLRLGGGANPDPAALTWEDVYYVIEGGALPTDSAEINYWQNVVAVADGLVCRYAPDAPAAVRREATLRTAGYLIERPASGWVQMGDGESKTVSFASAQLSALRHSGGMALLSPWKIRRAL